MRYSEEIIDEVRSRSNIVDIIGNYVQLKKKGNNYFGLCPFHNEKTGSFSVNEEKQMFYCFGCGKGGSVFTFLMEYENFTYKEAIEYLASQAGIELPKGELSQEQQELADYRTVLRSMNKDAANYFYKMLRHEHGKKGRDYLKKRQISEDVIKRFALGFADIYRDDLYQYLRKKGYTDSQLRDSGLVEVNEHGGHDKFWNRVMFPIVDMNGKVIGFGGRVLGDGEPKYLNSKETALFEKKKNLYGLNLARKSKRTGFILCEGYMDVISQHQAGFDNAVASLGTAFTQEQAQLIKRYRTQVYLAYDSDGAGRKAAIRAISICRRSGLEARVISLEPYKDPDEFIKNLGADAYEKRIHESLSGIMFEIQHLAKEAGNLEDPLIFTNFQKAAVERLAFISDKLERENYVAAVAREYQINERSLLDKVNEYGAKCMHIEKYEKVAKEDQKQHQKTVQDIKEGVVFQEKLLLTWIANYPQLLKNLDDIMTEQDFTSGITRKIAGIFLRQFHNSGTIQLAEVLDHFPDVEEHSQVSAILNQEVHLPENGNSTSDDMQNKAITESFVRVKEESIKRRMKELTENTESMQKQEDKNQQMLQLIKEQRRIKNLYITLDNG